MNRKKSFGRVCVLAVFVGAGLAPLTLSAETVWTGPTITYSQPAMDPTLPADQDRLTPHVWFTRGFSQGLFNAFSESAYQHSFSPADTEWAFGELANYTTLRYQNWEAWNGRSPPAMVGREAVVHLISENIYLAIKFTFWNSHGGGFSYQRSTPAAVVTQIPLNIQGVQNSAVLSWTNSAFSLQSATAVKGPFVTITNATSPYTNAISGAQQYFRLIH